MKKYRIVFEQKQNPLGAIKKLEGSIQVLLNDGWEPQGGVSVTTEVWYNTKWYIACQAMTKNE